MVKAMVFIDGTWLYANTGRLAESFGKPDFHLDYGKLPEVLAEEVRDRIGSVPVDIVRTYLFGSYATNYDLRDDETVQRRLDFFAMLKEQYNYEVETYPVNFYGRRLRRIDRPPDDTFEPREKCVDISLATTMVFYAAIPGAYDVSIAVVGDQDFKPVLQRLRLLGKRTAIVSIRGSCSPELSDPRDPARVRDFDMIWMDDLLDLLELRYERHQLRCESPLHQGERVVWTTFHPRRGQKFFCDECRNLFTRQKQEAQDQYFGPEAETTQQREYDDEMPRDELLIGTIARKIAERGYGFIRADEGRDYFFHLTDLSGGLEFDILEEGDRVAFNVKKEPLVNKAGAARNVHLEDDEPDLEDDRDEEDDDNP